MANERRIDDHSFWAGSKPKGATFPDNAKMKSIESVEGAGQCNYYPDTQQEVAKWQKEQVNKIDRHETKDGYRN